MSTTTNKRNISILQIASGDLWAGAEVQLYTLACRLQQTENVSIKVILFNHGTLESKLRDKNIEVLVIDETSLSTVQILKRLVHTIREQKPDVVHTHRIKENILGGIAAYFSGRVPSLRTAHGAPEHRPDWYQLPKRVIRLIDRLVGKFLQQKIIAVSDDLATILSHEFPAGMIKVIANGIELDSFSNLTNDRPCEENFQNNAITIGIAGRLVPVKRVDLFIRAAEHFKYHYPDLKAEFHIFGDGPLRSELEILARKLNSDDIVYFEGHCDNLTERLQKLDMLIMTSDHEGLPMVLLEAMALKVPIIAHAVGGIPELLDHGTCGILVEKHHPEAYAYEAHRLAESRSVRSELAAKAYKRAKAHYSADKNAGEYLAQYNDMRKQHK